VEHHEIERSLIFRVSSLIIRILDWMEVLVERDVKFRGKDFLRANA